MDPLWGTISFGLIAILSLSSGVLAFIFPARLGGWLQKLFPPQPQSPMTSPTATGLVVAGLWVTLGLVAAFGSLHHATRLLGG